MKKLGSAHLEMVIAFTLFIVFTIFLLFYLKAPVDNTISTTILTKLESSFLNSTTTELASFIVKPNEEGCAEINLANFSLSGNSSAVILKKAEWKWINGATKEVLEDLTRESNFKSNVLTIDASGINSSINESLRVYISEGISEGTNPCSSPNVSLVVGTIKREMVLSENKIKEFGQNYSDNYEILKSDILHLPSGVNFAVVSVGLINATRNIPSDVNTQSSRLVLTVVFANGTITKNNVDFTVW